MDSEQRDHLISRVVDRCENAADWEALAQLEREQKTIWRELAQALRCEAELRSAMAVELTRAEQVTLPRGSKPKARKPLPTWSGWLAAAACLLAWLLSTLSNPAVTPAAKRTTDNLAQASVQEVATDQEVPVADKAAATSIIIELPMVVVDAKPTADGEGYEVVYLRRVLETRRVDQVLELTADESGSLRPVPVDRARLTRPEAL